MSALLRKHKGVTGKFQSCSLMIGLRYCCTDPKRRQLLVELHALHRSMFMHERLCYYDRIQNALSHPESCMSCISDGMAQQHCILPHMAGIDRFGSPLSQHLQGVLEHGQLLTIYRTFHTIGNGANMQIFVLLSQLEQWYKKRVSSLSTWISASRESCTLVSQSATRTKTLTASLQKFGSAFVAQLSGRLKNTKSSLKKYSFQAGSNAKSYCCVRYTGLR